MNASVNQILFPGDTALAYLELAGATCVIYDHLTTLDVEIELIWNRPKWRIPQLLFIINRYLGLALQIYTASFFMKNLLRDSTERNDCASFNLINGFLAIVILFAMHGITVFRISSMYTHDRKILRILIAAYVTEFISVMIIQIVQKTYGLKVNNADISTLASGAFCAKENFMSWAFIIWIPLVLFEFLIFGLALSLGIKYHRAVESRKIFSDYRNSNRNTPLLYILFRDSIVFPFIFSLSYIINFTIFLQAGNRLRPLIAHIASLFPIVLSIIFGPRLILNLRESYYESFDAEFSIHVGASILSESEGDSILSPTQIPLSHHPL